MKKIIFYALTALAFVIYSCGDNDDEQPAPSNSSSDYRDFSNTTDFLNVLSEVSGSGDIDRILKFLDSLKSNNKAPYVKDDTAIFIYYGDVSSVNWTGDFNGWNANDNSYAGQRLDSTFTWILMKSFPKDARLDYKIVLNGSVWITDELNSYTQISGFGPNSELRMPDWEYPQETILGDGVVRGELSDNFSINSTELGYTVQYKVYKPYNYESLDSMAVLFVTDGHEYSTQNMGAAVTVLDNIIFEEKTEPILAVFIDPRNPDNLSENRRADEYTANINFANFVADELRAEIESNYKVKKTAASRAIMGTSLGGWNSAFFGVKRSDVFGKIIIHSPAFDQQIIDDYANSSKLDLDIFMSTGVIYDTQSQALAMKSVLDNKGYNLMYVEVNEGHSWGNWRALIDDPLIFLFPK